MTPEESIIDALSKSHDGWKTQELRRELRLSDGKWRLAMHRLGEQGLIVFDHPGSSPVRRVFLAGERQEAAKRRRAKELAAMAAPILAAEEGMKTPQLCALWQCNKNKAWLVLAEMSRAGLIARTHAKSSALGRWCRPEIAKSLHDKIEASLSRQTKAVRAGKVHGEREAVVQRTVPAALARPLHVTAARSVFELASC